MDNLEDMIVLFSDCGGISTALQGEIKSPNYPGIYPTNIQCIFEIQLPVGMAITMTFLDFSLETHADCEFDSLEVLKSLRAYYLRKKII